MKKKVLITGLTGKMGTASIPHFLKHKDKIKIRTVIRPAEKNRKLLDYYKKAQIEVVWGDLTQYEDVKKAVKDMDYILHLAAMVSPMADSDPEGAWAVNVGSTQNLLRAIDEWALTDIKFVYIGSVAQTGDRLPPFHWGRVGDPLKPSVFDHYAASKIAAERLVVESDLNYWVSLRQTGILHYKLLEMLDPIIYHQPLNNVLEWITEDDSGRMLANLCVKDLPDSFWKRIYNVGGGPSCRLTNYEFTDQLLKNLGVKSIEKVFERHWYAERNFHGQYYLDSAILNDFLDFRRESFDDFLERLENHLTYPQKVLACFPDFFIKHIFMKALALGKGGSLSWKKEKDLERIKAFYGTTENYEKLRTWEDFELPNNLNQIRFINHGYDEGKKESLLNLSDMKNAANFRGGKCLSKSMKTGDVDSKLKWECAFSHKFEASPRLVLFAGHWCPKCAAPPWQDAMIASKNPFFAQVYSSKTDQMS